MAIDRVIGMLWGRCVARRHVEEGAASCSIALGKACRESRDRGLRMDILRWQGWGRRAVESTINNRPCYSDEDAAETTMTDVKGSALGESDNL